MAGSRETDSRSEEALMVISDRKWSLVLQWEQNTAGFKVIMVITGTQ